MDESWFGALQAEKIGKMLQVLKKDVFPFSQFISTFIVLQAVSILSHLPTILCSPYGECLILIICPVNVHCSISAQAGSS